MRIILMNHHEALILDDHQSTVTVEPETDGVLTVNGKDHPVSHGGERPFLSIVAGIKAKAVFRTERGIEYKVIAPHIEKGAIVSRPDPFAAAIENRLRIDALEKELEAARADHREFKGSIKWDALGFITD